MIFLFSSKFKKGVLEKKKLTLNSKKNDDNQREKHARYIITYYAIRVGHNTWLIHVAYSVPAKDKRLKFANLRMWRMHKQITFKVKRILRSAF